MPANADIGLWKIEKFSRVTEKLIVKSIEKDTVLKLNIYLMKEMKEKGVAIKNKKTC